MITEDGHELSQRYPKASLTDTDAEKVSTNDPSEDVVELARFGKKQVLRVSAALKRRPCIHLTLESETLA